MKKLSNITNEQIKERGVQALADRPNAASQYGQSGLTAAQLKLWFDKLATFLAGKINELQNAISGKDAGEYKRVWYSPRQKRAELLEILKECRGEFRVRFIKPKAA